LKFLGIYFDKNLKMKKIYTKIQFRNLLGALAIFGLSSNVVAQTSTMTIPAIGDVFIAERYPTSNYNAYPTNAVGFYNTGSGDFSCGGLIKFNLNALPANSTITKATLSLYYADNNAGSGFVVHTLPNSSTQNNIYLQRIIQDWSLSTVNWSIKPSVTSLDQLLLPKPSSTSQNYANLDVTQMTKAMAANGNYGYSLNIVRTNTSDTNPYILTLGSFDNAKPEYRPQLVVEYCASQPSRICATVTTTSTLTSGVDIMLASRYPVDNYKSYPTNLVGFYNSQYTCESLIKFDFQSLPQDIEVNKASLNLYFADNNSGSGFIVHSMPNVNSLSNAYIQRVTQGWDINTVNWSSRPSSVDTNQILIAKPIVNTQNYLDIEATALTKDILKKQNNGYFLKFIRPSTTDVSQYILTLGSFDNVKPEYRPTMVIQYQTCTTQFVNTCPTTDINANSNTDFVSEETFKVYPNPAKGFVNLDNLENNSKVSVFNLLGKEIWSKETSGNTSFDLTGIEPGKYLIQITSESRTIVRKFIIE